MNIKEFAALKVGDKVENNMLSPQSGEVVETTDKGVHVAWGSTATRFFYSVNSSAWMHWSKPEPSE